MIHCPVHDTIVAAIALITEEAVAEEVVEEVVEEVAIEEVVEEEVVEEEVSKYPVILEETPTFSIFAKLLSIFTFRG